MNYLEEFSKEFDIIPIYNDPQYNYSKNEYYNALIGQNINNYIILSRLGSGTFSIVYKVINKKNNNIASMKIIKGNIEYHDYDVSNLKIITKNDPENKYNCIHLIDDFLINSQHFSDIKHQCVITNYCGENLIEYANKFPNRKYSYELTLKIAKEILIGLDFLHNVCNLVHTDIKPENICIIFNDDKTFNIKLIDFNNSCSFSEIIITTIQTRQYRCPESILHLKWNETSDIWSFGCVIYELIANKFLFINKNNTLSDIEKICGIYPNNSNIDKLKILLNKELNDYHAYKLSNFLFPCFHYDIKKRISAKQLLNSPLMQE